LILARRDEIEVAGAAAENGDWLLKIRRLSGRVSGRKRLKTQDGNGGEDSRPQLPLPGFSRAVNR
jgi:hypothetical protein